MIYNFDKRTGIDTLARKIKNGFKVNIDDIRTTNPNIINHPSPKPPKINGGKSLKRFIAKTIRAPWNFIKSKIEALIELKLTKLNQEIQALKKRAETLEVNTPPANLIHRNNSWKSNQNI